MWISNALNRLISSPMYLCSYYLLNNKSGKWENHYAVTNKGSRKRCFFVVCISVGLVLNEGNRNDFCVMRRAIKWKLDQKGSRDQLNRCLHMAEVKVMSSYGANGMAVSSDAQDFYNIGCVFNRDCSMHTSLVSLRAFFDTHRPIISL